LKFTDPSLAATCAAGSSDPQEAAERQNLCLEEKVSPPRQSAYEEFIGRPVAWPAWRARHKSHVSEHVRRRDPLSETFAADSPALYAGIEENQWLLRVERLDGVLDKFFAGTPLEGNPQRQLDRINGWIEASKPVQAASSTRSKPRTRTDLRRLGEVLSGTAETPEGESLGDLTDALNRERKDGRPAFVAFAPEFPGVDTDPNWARRLVGHCGLAHLQVGRPVLLALMRYRVREVLDAWRIGRATVFALPTALDQEFSGVFFPAPPGLSQGHALDLEPLEECRSLAAELLHARIDYRPEHWVRVASHEAGVFDYARLPDLRRRHLECLRTLSGQPEYGVACP